MIAGVSLMGISTRLRQNDVINGSECMILIGLGAYFAYVPYGSVLFDRIIAHTKFIRTAVFAIYVADAMAIPAQLAYNFTKTFLSVMGPDNSNFSRH